jgi:tetratricopeptide (TPR) repeat protein
MPVLHNEKFLNWTLLIIMYFIIRIVIVSFSSNPQKDPDLQVNKENSSDFATHFEKNKITFFIILFLIVTGLVEAIWGLFQLYGYKQSFNGNFKITGSFFNPAPYALYMAAVFPLALGVLLSSKEMNDGESSKSLKLFSLSPSFSRVIQSIHTVTLSIIFNKLVFCLSLLTVFAILIVLPATMIRASWLGLFAGSLIVLNYRYNLVKKIKVYLYNPARKLTAVGIIILMITSSALALFYIKKGSSNGRLLIWEVTLGKIAQKPLFGYGVGRFEAEYNNWQADYFKSHSDEMDGVKGMVAGNTKYCFNEYLEMAAEIGIIGLLLFIGIITFLLSRTKLRAQGSEPRDDLHDFHDLHDLHDPVHPVSRDFGTSFLNLHDLYFLKASLIAILVCAFISFPFYSIPTFIVLFFYLAVISSYNKAYLVNKSNGLTGNSILLKASAIIFLITSAFLIFFVCQQYRSQIEFNDAVALYYRSDYPSACNSFSKNYLEMKYSGTYLQFYGKALNMNEEFAQSVEILNGAKQYTTDEILYTTIGDNYKSLGASDLAEKAYHQASYMVPHKLYPKYLLVKLYHETGQNEKAIFLAEKVIKGKKIKVGSTATKEMIETMEKITQKVSMIYGIE